MALTGWEAYSAWILAREVQEFGCRIREDNCELHWELTDGRLWIGIVASNIVLGSWGSWESRRGRFSPDDPYSDRGRTPSCPGLVGMRAPISDESALVYAYVYSG